MIDLYIDGINPYHQDEVAKHNRLINFVELLDSEFIDLKQLRSYLFNGVPFLQKEYSLWFKENDHEVKGVTKQE